MRLFLITALAVFVMHGGNAGAADYPTTEEYMKILEEVDKNRSLFDMAVQSCISEVYSRKGYRSENGTGAIEDCIAGKGVELNVTGGRKSPQVYQMGKPDTPSVLTYQIPDKDALLQKLQGGSGLVAPENGAAAQAGQPPQSQGQPQQQQQTGGSSVRGQKNPSAQPKFYLPSEESKEGPKPIFLNR